MLKTSCIMMAALVITETVIGLKKERDIISQPVLLKIGCDMNAKAFI